MQRRRGANPLAVFLLWEQGRVGVSGGGGGRCRPENVGGRGLTRTQGSVGKRGGEERARPCAADVSRVFLFSGSSSAAVDGTDVVPAAAEVVSMLAVGSICRVLLTLTYPVIIRVILRPQGIAKASLWYKT